MFEDETVHKPLQDDEWPDDPDDLDAPDENYVQCMNCGTEYYWDLGQCPRCGSEGSVPESGMIWGWRKRTFIMGAWIILIVFIILVFLLGTIPGIPFDI